MIGTECGNRHLIDDHVGDDQAQCCSFGGVKTDVHKGKNNEIAVCGNRSGKRKVVRVGAGAAIEVSVRRIEIVRLVLGIVELDPRVAGGKVGAAAFGTIPGGVRAEQDFVEDDDA